MKPIIGLMATCPRETALKEVSVPSIARQIRLPDALVIVSDRYDLSVSTLKELKATAPLLGIHSLSNTRIPGAAGAWNTGLDYIHQRWPDAYIAILDDDDAWDADHLTTCINAAAKAKWPDAVVSGLRMNCEGALISRTPPLTLSIDDFLIGNPGWQGSNTFVNINRLLEAGGFTDGLTSCNDRDLAIRMLSLHGVSITFTGKFTSTWNLNASPDSLSQAGPQKCKALKKFLTLHGHRMTADVRQGFMTRCRKLFGVSEADLT